MDWLDQQPLPGGRARHSVRAVTASIEPIKLIES